MQGILYNSNLICQNKTNYTTKRVDRACDVCRIKKVKCNGAKPCSWCTNHNEICVFSKRKKKKSNAIPTGYIELLETRLHLLTKSLDKMILLSQPHLPFLGNLTDEDGIVQINSLISYLIYEKELLKDLIMEQDNFVLQAANLSINDIEKMKEPSSLDGRDMNTRFIYCSGLTVDSKLSHLCVPATKSTSTLKAEVVVNSERLYCADMNMENSNPSPDSLNEDNDYLTSLNETRIHMDQNYLIGNFKKGSQDQEYEIGNSLNLGTQSIYYLTQFNFPNWNRELPPTLLVNNRKVHEHLFKPIYLE